MEKAVIDNNNKTLRVGELYVKYERELFYYARGFLRDTYRAEDVVHLTFVNILENMDRLDISDEIKVRSLLYTVLKNLCCTELAKNRKYKLVEQPVLEDEHWLADDGYEYVLFKELLEGVQSLSDTHSQILMYKGFCDLKSEQIAKILNISPESVRQRLYRARKELKKYLDGES